VLPNLWKPDTHLSLYTAFTPFRSGIVIRYTKYDKIIILNLKFLTRPEKRVKKGLRALGFGGTNN
jgi:hypothetical protein